MKEWQSTEMSDGQYLERDEKREYKDGTSQDTSRGTLEETPSLESLKGSLQRQEQSLSKLEMMRNVSEGAPAEVLNTLNETYKATIEDIAHLKAKILELEIKDA